MWHDAGRWPDRVSQATALRVKCSPDVAAMEQRAMSAVQFSCRWRQRRTVKRNRNRGSHQLEQNPYPSGRVQPVECPNEIDKRAGQDPNLLPFDEVTIQSCQAVLGPLNQRFDDANGNGHRTTVPAAAEGRHAHRAAHRQPAIALKIQDDKQITRKQGRPYRFKPAGVTDRFVDLRLKGPKSLRAEMHFGLPFALWQRVSEKPPLVSCKRPRPDIEVQHG